MAEDELDSFERAGGKVCGCFSCCVSMLEYCSTQRGKVYAGKHTDTDDNDKVELDGDDDLV